MSPEAMKARIKKLEADVSNLENVRQPSLSSQSTRNLISDRPGRKTERK